MDFLYSDDPIVACSSGNTSNCAIAVIRFSGFISANVFKPFLKLNFDKLTPRKAYYCDLVHDGKLLDQVVATFFKEPNSYNGENILELSVHGSVLNVDRIVDAFVSTKLFRHAHPGEFSYRALKNKKLNLSQVEGLDLLLNASSSFALDQGFSLLNGRLQESYLKLQKAFLNHSSSVEMSIDFLEDMGEERANKDFNETLSVLKTELKALANKVSTDSNKLLKPEIALIGQPNSGKSTFFNQLVREERSIVTDIAGTTRDYISEDLKLGDVFFRLIDTAGLRESEDIIEMEGVKRSMQLGDRAFFKILLINPFEFSKDYFRNLDTNSFDLIIFTHFDKSGFKEEVAKHALDKAFEISIDKFGPIGAQENGSIGPDNSGSMGAKKPGSIGPESSGSIGAKNTGPMGVDKSGSIGPKSTGPIGAKPNELVKLCKNIYLASMASNNEALIGEVENLVNNKYLYSVSSEPILLQRHKQKILEASDLLENYIQISDIETDISIISSELSTIGHCISELIGIVSPDDVLHNIFDNFCIGK